MPGGDALRLLRVFNDMKLNSLANKLGISAGYLSEIENNKKQPTLRIIEGYGRVFQIKPSVILALSEKLDDKKAKNRVKMKISSAIVKALEHIANDHEKAISD